jgi:ubiquinone/menaquinone biosynthesis C-methylase UbiE
LDYSQFVLSINPSKIKVQGSALELPIKDKIFDIVFSSNLLHHLDNPLLAVREMARVSKKLIILIEPNRNNPLMFMYCGLNNNERHGMKFSLSYLEKLIVKANCMPLVEKTLGLILPNMTPSFILPLLKLFREENPYGFYNLLIAKV